MAISKNVGRVEQIIRIVVGILFFYLAYQLGSGTGWFLGFVGLFLIATALVSY